MRGLVRLGARPGARIGREDPLFAAIASSCCARRIAEAWPGMSPVRLTGFDERLDEGGGGWGVPWRQDRIIAVAARREAPGCTAWSIKGGVPHCEPPEDDLRRMLFVRLHLDPVGPANGGMEFVRDPRPGVVPAAPAARRAEAPPREIESAAPGDLLILPMLALHRSAPSMSETGRLVLRIDFADRPPPAPLDRA